MRETTFSSGLLLRGWRQACRQERLERWRQATAVLVPVAGILILAASLAGMGGVWVWAVAVVIAVGGPVIHAVLPLQRVRVVRRWDRAVGAGEGLQALESWPEGALEWRLMVERQAEAALARSGDWRGNWPRTSLRPALLGLALWLLAAVVATEDRGGDALAQPGSVPVAEGEEQMPAAAVDPRLEEPAAEVQRAAAIEAELAAALLALQVEAEQMRDLRDRGQLWKAVAQAAAEALLQWEGEAMADAVAAAERQDWQQLAAALERAAAAAADPGQAGAPRPRAGAEGAVADTAERLAGAMERAGDQAGAEAARALAQAGREGGEGAAGALEQMRRSAEAGADQAAAATAAGAAAGLADALRQALADAAGSETGGTPEGAATPGPSAGTETGAAGDPVADVAARLWAQLQSGTPLGGPAEQFTVAAGMADLLRARESGEASLAGQAASRAPGEPESVPMRHRAAVERYFEARRQVQSAAPGGVR